MKILISAFEPFGQRSSNSSLMALEAYLPVAPAQVLGTVLPVSFKESWLSLKNSIEREAPDLVLALGQADSRSKLSLEQVALNWRDSSIADNQGFQPVDQPIVKSGPLALWSGLSMRRILTSLHNASVPAEISYSAGTYVCNDVYFQLLLHAATHGYLAGFVHCPLVKEQGQKGEMPLNQLVRGLGVLVESCLALNSEGMIQ